jgi:hypothetical protein
MPNFSLYSFLRNENHLFHLAQNAEARILESTFFVRQKKAEEDATLCFINDGAFFL